MTSGQTRVSAEPMRVPFFDLGVQTARLESEIAQALERVVRSRNFVLGAEVAAFEGEVAAYLGTRHAIGVSSGTDALTVALLALGIGAGDEVITTPFSFFATTGAILRVGARPVFADIERNGFNLDPERVAAAVSPRTRAILPVHLFGQAADMARLLAVADRHSLPLIEDTAQAAGARFAQHRLGAVGALGCFSFFPTKNLGGFGDGGLVTTSDDGLAALVRSLRGHGFVDKHHSVRLGGNFRLDALQAAVLRVKLPLLNGFNARRRGNAAHYLHSLGDLADRLVLPRAEAGRDHVYHQFVIRCRTRDALKRHLGDHGIGSEVYYPLPIHLHETCRGLGYGPGDFEQSEAAARECLALPIFPELEPHDLDAVCGAVRTFFEG